jgi:electron transfer flavoprotein alpha subunit
MAVSKIWVFAEADGDKPAGATLEILTKARDLADTVEAVYVGANADALAAGLGEHGATKVFAVDPGDGLPGIVGAAALQALVGEHSPDAVLFAQSYDGRDAIARLSVKLDRPVLTNGTDLKVDGDKIIVGTAIFGGVTLVDTEFDGDGPFLAAIRPKSFAAAPSGGAPAEIVAVPTPDAGRAGEAKVLERHVEEREGPKLEDATVVVSGGRGIGSAEAYEPLVEELAKLLNGASGASRAIVDAGWVPYSKQVGQTGKVVKPKLYIALGISGATQHMVGMKGSDNIICVNKDGEAPIDALKTR